MAVRPFRRICISRNRTSTCDSLPLSLRAPPPCPKVFLPGIPMLLRLDLPRRKNRFASSTLDGNLKSIYAENMAPLRIRVSQGFAGVWLQTTGAKGMPSKKGAAPKDTDVQGSQANQKQDYMGSTGRVRIFNSVEPTTSPPSHGQRADSCCGSLLRLAGLHVLGGFPNYGVRNPTQPDHTLVIVSSVASPSRDVVSSLGRTSQDQKLRRRDLQETGRGRFSSGRLRASLRRLPSSASCLRHCHDK